MSNRETARSLRNSRVLRSTTAPVAEFENDRAKRSFVRPLATGLLAAGLSLGVAAGVVTAASASASVQDRASSMVDKNTPDKAEAKPVDKNLSAEQQAAIEAKLDKTKREDTGALQAFQQRGTTVNRNSVRTQLSQELNSTSNGDRSVDLGETNSQVTAVQAAAEQKKREQEMDADIAKVKKEAARIKEEKRKAAELLKKQQEEAAKKRAAANSDALDADGGDAADAADAASDAPADADVTSITSSGGGAMPLKAGTFRVGAGWGATGSWARYHTGQDFGAGCGTPVYAATTGVVGSSVGGWAGNSVVLHHSNGGSTLYAHLSSRSVGQGSVVKAGQLIGHVGNTGRSFGCHLHFEYYPSGTTPGDVYSTGNPMSFLRSMGVGI